MKKRTNHSTDLRTVQTWLCWRCQTVGVGSVVVTRWWPGPTLGPTGQLVTKPILYIDMLSLMRYLIVNTLPARLSFLYYRATCWIEHAMVKPDYVTKSSYSLTPATLWQRNAGSHEQRIDIKGNDSLKIDNFLIVEMPTKACSRTSLITIERGELFLCPYTTEETKSHLHTSECLYFVNFSKEWIIINVRCQKKSFLTTRV